MPRCYPPEPHFPPERQAERDVWQALRDQLPDDALLFHSVNLIEGDREREADLLIGWPDAGLAVIEVKGGQVSREDGQWYQASARENRPIDSPVAQAQDARHMLVRYLATSGLRGLRAAHLVAFPYTRVPRAWRAPDCARDMVIGKDDLDEAAPIVLRPLR